MNRKNLRKDEKGEGLAYAIFILILGISLIGIAWVSLTPLVDEITDVGDKWTENNPELYNEDLHKAKVTTKNFFKYSPLVGIIALGIYVIVISIRKEDDV